MAVKAIEAGPRVTHTKRDQTEDQTEQHVSLFFFTSVGIRLCLPGAGVAGAAITGDHSR